MNNLLFLTMLNHYNQHFYFYDTDVLLNYIIGSMIWKVLVAIQLFKFLNQALFDKNYQHI